MSLEISERSFEETIECGLLQHGPDACAAEANTVRETSPPYGDTPPGGYRKRGSEDYDRMLCLLPRDVVDFVLATQPKEWKKLEQHHGTAVREQFLKRVAAEIERRGALDVLRSGIKDSGCKFRLAYFRPASGLNEETRRLHAANLFAVVRQVHYSTKNEKSLDLVLFLNGIPIFTAELKNPLNGQDVEDAIRQYKTDRDAREPLLACSRCLAHFAVDPDLVYVASKLQGGKTRFLPFNQGKFGGAGNPPVPPTRKGYATAYLWEETWARDSVLDLARQFIHEVEEEDENGRKTGQRFLIFPRYQQLDCVRRLVADARAAGAGQRYLIQHSAGSGKSFTIAWLAHQLSTLHDAADRRVFDSLVVVTDRRVPNLSTFAFTATPKPKTLELFGTQLADGKFAPFHLYSMRQAIEEGFILDVLANYTTYKAYWRLLKKVEHDPRYDKKKAEYLLKSFVELHPHAITEKVRICVEHFAAQVQGEVGGKAKAMIVTRSRLHAVRYRLAVDRYLAERGYPFKVLVAFSGTVKDGGTDYTEAGMNGLPEVQTAKTFERQEYRFLIVANKFQTGFDQPPLHTMYVDKKLGGVNAVQTLSRLNRTLPPEKKGTMVLDFANEADEIKAGFEPYYETTMLSEATDPNLLYEIQTRLAAFPVYAEADVETFAKVYFDPRATQDRLYAALAPVVENFQALSPEEQHDFRGQLTDYVRLYAFLAHVLTFADADLEKLYVFARHLRRLLPADRAELPREVQQNIDMESYRIQQTGSGKIALERRPGVLEPVSTKPGHGTAPEELEALSRIIAELNERFGLNLGPEHRLTLGQMMERLDADPGLDASARVNTRENVRLTFDQKVEHAIQDIVDSNFELYKRITDDPAFGAAVKNFLFDQYLRAHRQAEELIKRGESKTLEFKSTLRWSLKDGRQDDKGVTHAVLKTLAAFLNTEGGDLLIGVADDGAVVGIEQDQLETDDKFMRHLAQVARNGLGDRAGTCIDPAAQIVQGRTVCVVSCQRSPEPVFLKWKGMEASPEGDFYVRSGPGTVKLPPGSAWEYIRTRFPGLAREGTRDAPSEGAV